jgi:hypothetical protein
VHISWPGTVARDHALPVYAFSKRTVAIDRIRLEQFNLGSVNLADQDDISRNVAFGQEERLPVECPGKIKNSARGKVGHLMRGAACHWKLPSPT